MNCQEHNEDDFASCSRCLANYWEAQYATANARIKELEKALAARHLMFIAALKAGEELASSIETVVDDKWFAQECWGYHGSLKTALTKYRETVNERI